MRMKADFKDDLKMDMMIPASTCLRVAASLLGLFLLEGQTAQHTFLLRTEYSFLLLCSLLH